MSKKSIETIDFESFKLSGFSYKLIGCVKDSRFNQVECTFKCNNELIKCFIDYPKGFCSNDNEFIDKAKEYIKIVTDNGEIFKYSSEYLKGKPYQFLTPLNLGAFNLKAYEKSEAKKKEEELRLAKEKQKQAKILEAKKAEELRLKEEEKKKALFQKQLAGIAGVSTFKNRIKELETQNALLLKENDKLKENIASATNNADKLDKKAIKLAEIEAKKQAKEDAKQAKLLEKESKKENDGENKPHKGLKVAFVLASIIAVAGIGTSTYLYLTRGKGGDTPVVGDDVVVSFDLNGAITKTGSKTFARVKKNTKFSEVSKPDIIAPAGKTFANEWKIKDGEKISPDYTLTADTSIEPIFTDNQCQVTVNVGDGSWSGEPTEKIRTAGTFNYGTKWGDVVKTQDWLKDPTKFITPQAKYQFAYFGYNSEGKYLPVGDDYIIKVDTEIKVCYTPTDAVTIGFDLNGGSSSSTALAVSVPLGTTWKEIADEKKQPSDPTKTGYTFKQWEVTEGTKIGDGYVFNVSTTVKAAYTINTHTVKVDINEGKWVKEYTGDNPRTVGTFEYGTTWSTIVNTEGVKDWLKSDNITAPDDKQFCYFGYSKDSGATYLPIYDDYVITANTTIKVIYTAKDTVTLFLDPNGGSFKTDSSTELKIVENVQTSTTWGSIKDNYILVKDAYDYKGYKVGDTAVKDTDTFSTSTYLKGYYEIAASKSWSEDSLVSIDAYATKGVVKSETNETLYGLPALIYLYKKDSFIGMTKQVKVGDNSYNVIVIGEKEDYIDNTFRTQATLTFQFEKIIDKYDLTYSTKADNSNKYESSNLRNQLNNNLAKMIKTTTGTSLENTIKTIYKKTAVGGVAEKTDLVTTGEKVFLPSAKELGFTSVPYELEGTAVSTLAEGSTYSYYNDSATAEGRRKKTVDYQLRSPDYLTSYFAWSVNTEGSLGIKNDDVYESLDVTSACSIAPCFCIGEERAS